MDNDRSEISRLLNNCLITNLEFRHNEYWFVAEDMTNGDKQHYTLKVISSLKKKNSADVYYWELENFYRHLWQLMQTPQYYNRESISEIINILWEFLEGNSSSSAQFQLNEDALNQPMTIFNTNDQNFDQNCFISENAQEFPISRCFEANTCDMNSSSSSGFDSPRSQDLNEYSIHWVVSIHKLASLKTYIYNLGHKDKFFVHEHGKLSEEVENFLPLYEKIDLSDLIVVSEKKLMYLNQDDISTDDSSHQHENKRNLWPRLKVGVLLEKLMLRKAIKPEGEGFVIQKLKRFENILKIAQ